MEFHVGRQNYVSTSVRDPNMKQRIFPKVLFSIYMTTLFCKYSRLSLSRIRRDPLKHFEISVLRHIRFVVLNKKQLEQINFTNDYVI